MRDANLTNPSGWIPVDPQTLRVNTASEIGEVYAVGDVTVRAAARALQARGRVVAAQGGGIREAQGRVVAHQIAAKVLGSQPRETFDGAGYCYLETGGGRAVKADGSFFELPHPVMRKQPPDEAQFRDKLDWVARLLGPGR